MPGEPEVRREAERMRMGIPLTAEVLAALRTEAEAVKLAMPEFSPAPISGCA
jgi:LDH2 family malate/lactate/ureidoglycolate dehydrogenase